MNAKQCINAEYMGGLGFTFDLFLCLFVVPRSLTRSLRVSMATSIYTISRRIFRSVALSKRNLYFSTSSFSAPQLDSDSAQVSQNLAPQRNRNDELLDNGIDAGIYRAILVGQVGQPPIVKTVSRSGRRFVHFSVGTGGIHNNRKPLVNEDPMEYANRCSVQWHRVCIYHQNMVDMAMKNIIPGSIVYLEGNLETRLFTDPATGLARRIREIAIHKDGRIVFLGEGDENQQSSGVQVKSVGYF